MAKKSTKKDYTEEFSPKDFNLIAEYIDDELNLRKRKRADLEKAWADIDRQLAMIPDVRHKQDAYGRPDKRKSWMPEAELPLQSQTLEVLVADSRRMLCPDSGPWFNAHAMMTDEYLQRVDFSSLITGDENEVPSIINQDNADKLVIGMLDHFHRQYDFWGNIDLINAEAFKYGVGVGRGRLATKHVFMEKAAGTVKQTQEIPVLFPVSIKNTYLDDRPHMVMNEGQIIGSAVIFCKTMSILDLRIAAENGSKDPENENGGWIPDELTNIKPDKDGYIEVAEYEGDLIVSRDQGEAIFIPNALATIVIGTHRNKIAKRLIRLRFRKTPFSSYIEFPYHCEHVDSPYATSPLMKGWPLQKAAVESLNWLMISAALNCGPPISYDSDDTNLAQTGGPQVHPFALWGTTGEIKPHQIGDPSALFNVYAGLLAQYADVTGTHAPRLGAQTLSHTTAYAKEAELARGTVRTVDYVKASLKGPLTRWLSMAFELGRPTIKDATFYIEAYNGFVTVEKKHIPDAATFDAHGSGGPSEEQSKQQQRLTSLQFAMQVDQMKGQAKMLEGQTGIKSSIDFDGAIQQVLMEGKWTDLDSIYNPDSQVQK